MQSIDTPNFEQKFRAASQKFTDCLTKCVEIQERQYKLNNKLPQYPLFMVLNANQIIIHFGPTPITDETPPTIKVTTNKTIAVPPISKLKETKNIPKNFTKAIISYICKNKEQLRCRLEGEVDFDNFIGYISKQKQQLSNIRDIAKLLQEGSQDKEQNDISRVFRKISSYFIKKHSIGYVFNSRIAQINWHLKYRRNYQRALKNPWKFTQLKNI